jgi:hypothetical protein
MPCLYRKIKSIVLLQSLKRNWAAFFEIQKYCEQEALASCKNADCKISSIPKKI